MWPKKYHWPSTLSHVPVNGDCFKIEILKLLIFSSDLIMYVVFNMHVRQLELKSFQNSFKISRQSVTSWSRRCRNCISWVAHSRDCVREGAINLHTANMITTHVIGCGISKSWIVAFFDLIWGQISLLVFQHLPWHSGSTVWDHSVKIGAVHYISTPFFAITDHAFIMVAPQNFIGQIGRSGLYRVTSGLNNAF